MPIHHLADGNTFFLDADASTYAIRMSDFGCPVHLHWGNRIAPQNLDHLLPIRGRAFSPNPVGGVKDFSLNDLPLEHPVYGNSDFRSPALEIFRPHDGSRIVDLRYTKHAISRGKPILDGLPATFADNESQAETLVIELRDTALGLRVELSYTAFDAHPVITRSVRYYNEGAHPLDLRRALSCSVDLSSSFSNYHFLQLSGNWARERDAILTRLRPGTQSVESRRGTSSHQQNPFFALTELGSQEEHGAVYGFNLVYSGNFLACVEVDEDGRPRAQIGINPFDFSWQLDPGGSFQTPEAVLVFANDGLGGMSRALHRFYRQHLGRSSWQHQPRPILINNWEATYFDFDADKLERIATAAADMGIELFVLDDGWFGRRDDDRTSLGDWTVDLRKLPGGLEDLAARINAKGLRFGLWFEPEMVSPDSDFYRAHPDWCLHAADRPRTPGRSQLVLDLSRPEVCEEVYRRVAHVLRTVPIAYVKWDMNRHLTEVGSPALPPERQQETAHRYMLGLYALMDRFVRDFPEILFEGCSGGGGRFDPGILHYMPQIWTSDNTDAVARLRIQHGTSLAYPLSTMGAHVSVVPNHAVGRTTPFDTRGHVAFTAAFGYELDLSQLSGKDQARVRGQTAFFKQVRSLLLQGELYRLRNPFESNESAWMVVSPDRTEALVTHVNILAECNPPTRFLPLRGIHPQHTYHVDGTGQAYRGDALLEIGLLLPIPSGDFVSTQWHLVGRP